MTCKDCYNRNPETGWCPKKGYEVEEDHESCACFAATAAYIKSNQTSQTKPMMTKKCKRCGLELPLSAFPRSAKSGDGHLNYCTECHGKNIAERIAKRKEINQGKELLRNNPPVLPDSNKFAEDVLKTIISADLVAELRARGYEAKAVRTITEEL